MFIPQIKRIAFLKRILASHDKDIGQDFGPLFRDEKGSHGYATTDQRKEESAKSFRERTGISQDDYEKYLKDEDIQKHVDREWRHDLTKEDKITKEKLLEYLSTYPDREKIRAGLDEADYSGTNTDLFG